MPTIDQLAESALGEVLSETQTIDTSTYLAESISGATLSFAVADASGFSRGIVQVDDELLFVDGVDRSANTLSVGHISGRGIRGTTAAVHDIGARVTMSPTIPRHKGLEAVRETLRASAGLFAVGTHDITISAATRTYTLPAEVDTVLEVVWDPGLTLDPDWVAVRRWSHSKHRQQITIGDWVTPGGTVRVSYAKLVAIPDADEDFALTGLPDSCIDVIRFGAAWRLVSFIEPFNLLSQRAEAQAMAGKNTPGSRVRVAQYFYQMYQQRLNEEVARLQRRYPIRVHFGGTR